MMLWTPGESDRNTRADERYEEFTPLSKPPSDPISAFWAALEASRVRVAFDARNAREVA